MLGTGFIGCELAASLAMRGARVTLVGQEPAPQQQRLGADVAAHIASWLTDLGVSLKMGVEVRAVHNGRIVQLEDGKRIEAENVVLGMGVRPRSELAEHAGLTIGKGAILTDARCARTSECSPSATSPTPTTAAPGDGCAWSTGATRSAKARSPGACSPAKTPTGRTCPASGPRIGQHTIKYAAWGDGYDTSRLEEHPDGAFTVWYSHNGKLVGVLTHDRDEDYEHGRQLIAAGESPP